MLKVEYKIIETPFEYAFTTNKGSKTHQQALLVKLQFGSVQGFGESPVIVYYNVNAEIWISKIESKKHFIEKYSYTGPERFWHFLHHLFPNDSFLINAFDMASWDLYGKMKMKTVQDLIQFPPNEKKTNYTIGIDDIELMLRKIEQHPFDIYKVKVNTKVTIEHLQQIITSSNSVFRIDANEGWTEDYIKANQRLIQSLNLEFIEQPFEKTYFPINDIELETIWIADEAFQNMDDLEKIKGFYNGINIKLTKCGGITPAIEIIKKARELNLKILLGNMNETGLGSAALVALSGYVDFIDIDGPLLLKDNHTLGLYYQNQIPRVKGLVGLGVEVNF